MYGAALTEVLRLAMNNLVSRWLVLYVIVEKQFISISNLELELDILENRIKKIDPQFQLRYGNCGNFGHDLRPKLLIEVLSEFEGSNLIIISDQYLYPAEESWKFLNKFWGCVQSTVKDSVEFKPI